MSWQVSWGARAIKDLSKLDPPDARRIYRAVHKLADTGHGDLKLLKGSDEYRLRVGNWRVRLEYNLEEYELVVIRVLHRREGYRK